MTHRLQAGVDFSLKRADFCLLFPDGRPLEPHVAFANSVSGYSLAKRLLLDALDTYSFDGIDLSGEATGYLWLPFFLQLAADPDLAAYDLVYNTPMVYLHINNLLAEIGCPDDNSVQFGVGRTADRPGKSVPPCRTCLDQIRVTS